MSKRDQFETNMSREIESHLEQATQDYIARGLSAEEARLRARRDFGGMDLAKEKRHFVVSPELRDCVTEPDPAITCCRRSVAFAP